MSKNTKNLPSFIRLIVILLLASLLLIIIRDEAGRPLYRDGYVRDVTQQKADEEQLKESEQLYRVLFDNTEDGFIILKPILDQNGNSNNLQIIRINSAWEYQMGITANSLEGKHLSEVMPNITQTWCNKFAQVAETGKPKRIEIQNQTYTKWYDLYAFPYKQNEEAYYSATSPNAKKPRKP
jgi:PAS domain S-box-containing protein